ncbi:10026_t:CDS:2, partial [Gigaspora rosea]
MTCKCKFNGHDKFEYCCYHDELINKKSYVTNNQSYINFVMVFEQAYIQVVTEQLQKEAEEEAEEVTDSDEKADEANQTNPTPLPDQSKQNNPKPNPSPLPSPTSLPTQTDNLFKRLQKEIKETQIENAINLVDNKTIDQKIKNSKLQNNQIDQLQKYCDYFDNINSNQVMTLIQISTLLQIVKSKILKIQQDIEFNEIKTRIEKETNTTKLEVNWNQKDTLHRLRNNKYWNLRKNEIFDKFKQDIENEAFISNLLDGNLHDTLIINDTLLNEEQKEKLYELRKQQI